MAMVNPLAGVDHQIAGWFHAHLTQAFVNLLRTFSEPGSAQWIGVVLFLAVALLVWKRAWPALVTLIVAVPGGMLLNELLKLVVHRHRPFLDSWFVDWSGYSFASGHTMGATLLYGQLLLFLLPLMKSKRWQRLSIPCAAMLVMLVGFSRIALGGRKRDTLQSHHWSIGIYFEWQLRATVQSKPGASIAISTTCSCSLQLPIYWKVSGDEWNADFVSGNSSHDGSYVGRFCLSESISLLSRFLWRY